VTLMEARAGDARIRADRLVYERQKEWRGFWSINLQKLKELIAWEIREAVEVERQAQARALETERRVAKMVAPNPPPAPPPSRARPVPDTYRMSDPLPMYGQYASGYVCDPPPPIYSDPSCDVSTSSGCDAASDSGGCSND